MPKSSLKVCRCGKQFEPIIKPNSTIKSKYCIDCLVKKGKEKVHKELKAKCKSQKSISQLIQEARIPFQKFVRIRDQNLPCISCGVKESQTWQGGHYLKAELYTGLIFNEDNCHKQCLKCNHWLDGNESNYRIGLVKRIGEERVKWLEENKDRLRNYKYTREELINIKKEYAEKIKLYKNNN